MTEHGVTADTDDRRLAATIATALRIGTGAASVLLTAGAVLAAVRVGILATALLAGGCAVLVLLPVVRLVLMAAHFTRLNDRRFVVITVVVLGLVAAGGVSGLLL